MSDQDPLRDLLRQKINEVHDEVVSTGSVPAAKLEALEQLSRLAKLQSDMLPPRQPPRWPVAVMLGGTLILVSILLFFRVPRTEIEMELVLSEVGFKLSEPQVLTEVWNLSELRASGLRAIALNNPSPLNDPLLALANPNAIRVTAAVEGARRGELTLAPVSLARDAEVRVLRTKSPAEGRIVLSGTTSPLRVALFGPVLFGPERSENRAIRFNTPKSVVLEPDPEGADISVVFAGEAEFSSRVAIQQLSLSRIDQFQTLDQTIIQPVSTIESGTLFLESLNGAKYPLRPRELLLLGNVTGNIRTLNFVDGHIHFNFRGTVGTLRSGWAHEPVNLMPTYLEWLQARHALSLLWGSTLYVFGLLAAVVRWWRVWP